ncbi:ExeM/NucH family extracellular endonuclease [Flexibacterium corallicola]|uniref:ExeM/NucH family extracellular endonuclease n=1 Tax=Flexibacterium corallicola TaxID=3037259 RepID=UPI00286F1968|nr:ExeM/NucH family extracellular endonuclease [Pseudovibrio sp. M1P-2-3]
MTYHFRKNGWFSKNYIFGTWGDDALQGTDGADKILSSLGNDWIEAGAGDDTVFAGFGDDTISGGDGNDIIDGGFGFDTAWYSGSVRDYSVASFRFGFARFTSVAALDASQIDTLTNVESLYFEGDDYTLYLDGTNNEVIATEDTVAIDEDSGLSLTASELLANDLELDGDELTITSVSNSAAGATVSLNGESISYDAGSVFDHLAAGETFEDTFTYLVTDGQGSETEATVTVVVTGTNDAPVLSLPTSVEVNEGETSIATASAIDIDGDALTYSISGGEDSALFQINAETGELSFITPADFEAPADSDGDNTYSLDITVTDSNGATDVQSITVTVADVVRETIAYDMVGSSSEGLLNYSNTAPDFGSAGDAFAKMKVGDSIPFALLDESNSSNTSDTAGIIDAGTNADEFFGIVDTQNADNSEPVQASWTFDVSGYMNLSVALDAGAMGDFEATDSFEVRYSLDGGEEQVLFTFSADESGSQTYTLANGSEVTLNDPLVETSTGTVLSNELQTLLGDIEGVGSELTIIVEAQADGGSEALALQNLKIEGEPIQREVFAYDLLNSESRNLVSYTNDAPDFSSGGDAFGIMQVGDDVPFSLVDESSSTYPSDTAGIIDAGTNTDSFFGAVDTINGDNSGPVTASWTFDISGYSNIALSLDAGAMGDFEADDSFVFTYSIDGGASQELFAFEASEDESQTYTLAGGTRVSLDDPLVETGSGVTLSNELQTLLADIAGTGSELTVSFQSTADGGSEAFAFQNLQLEGDRTGDTGPVEPTFSVAANEATIREGDSGTTTVEFTVMRSGDASEAGSVEFYVEGDVDAEDFGGVLPTGSVSFEAGETSQTISLELSGDIVTEFDEGLTVSLTNPVGGTISSGSATTTVINDDYSITAISEIQGSGDESPMVGAAVNVSAIVTYVAEDGFFLQEEDSDSDGNDQTSEGVFVYTGSAPTIAVGDHVELGGTVGENFGQTQLSNITNLTVLSSGNNLPSQAQVTLPFANSETLEKYEGMRISLDTNNGEALTVIENFSFDRYGEITVSAGTQTMPTQIYDAQDQAEEVAELIEQNQNNRIIIDDANSTQNPDEFTFVPVSEEQGDNGNGYLDAGDDFSQGATLRLGAELDAPVEGVMSYSYGEYRVYVDDQISIDESTNSGARTDAPEDTGGNLTVSSFNVLNYFTSLGERGASSEADLERQTAKLVNAMLAIDADVFGVQEVENNGFGDDSAIQSLVDALNAELIEQGRTDELYTYVNPSDGAPVGTDVITTGIIYKESELSLVTSDVLVYEEPSAAETYAIAERLQEYASRDYVSDHDRNRPTTVATFEDNNGEVFTLGVNHYKSKGPSGLDSLAEDIQSQLDAGTIPAEDVAQVTADLEALLADPNFDQNDGQGFWNQVRTDAASELGSWIETDYAGAGLDEDFLVIGDFNSYAQEDPLDALRDDAGMVDIIDEFVGSDEAYSFVFDGQQGSLDQALASDSLADQVTGVTEWHINADEPDLLSYDSGFTDAGFYDDGPYGASDHDPLVIGLDLGGISPIA